MAIFSLILYFASVMCAVTGVVAYFLNRRSKINIIFSIAAFLGAYWAFTEAMMWQSSNIESAFFWNKASFLWAFFAAFVVHFALEFSENKLANPKFVYLFLYLPATVFSIFSLFIVEYPLPVNAPWGYYIPYDTSLFTYVAGLWAGGFTVFATLLCIRYYFKTTNSLKKLQARCVAIGFSIPVFAYTITNIIFPLSNVTFPNLGNISTGGLVGLIAYAIWKYELFSIDPANATENIISTMPDSLVLSDLKGKILKVNRAMINFLDYSEPELIGKCVSELFIDKNFGETILSELNRKREISNVETKFKTKCGEEKFVLFSASIVKSNRGYDIGITCIFRDITTRKFMEEKLVRAERFASIGELAGMIGHDLRNPSASISGATYYLKKKYSNDIGNPEKEMFNTIEASIEYSNKIITDLLDYSRSVNLDLSIVTPKFLSSNIFSIVQTPSNVCINNLTTDDYILNVDVSKMIRVFSNIVKNAFDAMPRGGTLTITNSQLTNYVMINFCDTGEGISENNLNILWEPLFTTKTKGMGFGLAICKRIVEAHGGNISVQSILGKGTTFTVAIPIVNKLPNIHTALLPKKIQ